MTEHLQEPVPSADQKHPEPSGPGIWTPLLWIGIPLLLVIVWELLRAVE